MDALIAIDWRSVFIPQHSLLEAVLRGTLIYLAILVMLRMVLRRQVGGIGTPDILVIVLIAEVSGNGIAPNEQSVPEAVVLVSTILLWSYVIEWLQWRFPLIERLVREPKLKLVDNGRMLRKNMRREFVTPEELMAQLREEGRQATQT